MIYSLQKIQLVGILLAVVSLVLVTIPTFATAVSSPAEVTSWPSKTADDAVLNVGNTTVLQQSSSSSPFGLKFKQAGAYKVSVASANEGASCNATGYAGNKFGSATTVTAGQTVNYVKATFDNKTVCVYDSTNTLYGSIFFNAASYNFATGVSAAATDDVTTKWVDESFDGSTIIGSGDMGLFFQIIITPIGTGLSWTWDNYGTEILVFLIAMGIVTVLFAYMRLGRARHRGMRIR